MLKHYKNRHRSQFDRGSSRITRSAGCTWTTGANGIDACTGGRKRPTPDRVHSMVGVHEQTKPALPGWSLPDLDLACNRLGIDLRILSGWDNLQDWRDRGYGIALQGDSDVFESGCMSTFDGDHCIYIHPDESKGRWRVDDPLCPEATHRSPDRIHEYAQKLADASFGGIIRFGVFTPSVPRKED